VQTSRDSENAEKRKAHSALTTQAIKPWFLFQLFPLVGMILALTTSDSLPSSRS
jgi:hypothetical protein